MTLDDLPPLRDSLSAHGLMANKSFGQHFLLDLNITRKIARLAGPLDGRAVIEVGPGPGGLTRALLEAGAQVVAVEKDPRFLPLLEDVCTASGGRLTLVRDDALRVDEAALLAQHAPGLPLRIVSNLPYNVGTPLLIKWLTGALPWEAMALMFQKEVAERIVAPVHSEAYGRLAVSSAVVLLTPRADRPSDTDIKALEAVTHAAFGQRRKMLRGSLKQLGGEALCLAAGIDPNARGETVDVEGFLRLARAIKP